MSHGEEGVVEDVGGNGPVLGVDQQHGLQQGHELPPVRLLRLHVAVVGAQHQVHLADKKRRREKAQRASASCRHLLGNTDRHQVSKYLFE